MKFVTTRIAPTFFLALLLLVASTALPAAATSAEIGAGAKHHKAKKNHHKKHHKKHRKNRVVAPAAPPPNSAASCDHPVGDYVVQYGSRESFESAPQENVVESDPDDLLYLLRFEEIRDEPNPDSQRLMDEDKLAELRELPGVTHATYDCYRSPDLPPPA